MIQRQYWHDQVEMAWREKSILWLSGVRRAGKTVLCQGIKGIEYFDCELPRVRRMMEDPEGFLDGLMGKKVVLDEIHRLDDPAELLKIAADHYPDIKIIATGSSTLGASSKFKDTLTGRKRELWLCPMISEDLKAFGVKDLKRRFLRGGLPSFFLAKKFPEKDFQEWIDAYWAKDIQELFHLERKHSFQKFFELLMIQSGGMFEASSFAAPCEVSRTTIANYLSILEATFAVNVIRPFHTHLATEIIAAPKVYAFDTGFFCYYRGWESLREDDLGILWEHFVLNEIQARLQNRDVHYWRDKQGHEIDFILTSRGKPPIAIECKWSAGKGDHKNVAVFLDKYPQARVLSVSHDNIKTYAKRVGTKQVLCVSLADCIKMISEG